MDLLVLIGIGFVAMLYLNSILELKLQDWPENVPIEPRTVKEIVQHEIIYETLEQGGNPHNTLAVARCESGFKPGAQNPASSAAGVYQFINGTWASTPSGKRGLDQTDYKANIKEGVRLLTSGQESHWYASYNCWGYQWT